MPWAAADGEAAVLLGKVGVPDDDADRQCGTYSGGNRRKLAVAVALVSVNLVKHLDLWDQFRPTTQVGDPTVVLLDEPSTGMDPGARRQLWGLIRSQVVARLPSVADSQAGRCVMLSSHTMDECEALCSRIAIMAKGKIRFAELRHIGGRFPSFVC